MRSNSKSMASSIALGGRREAVGGLRRYREAENWTPHTTHTTPAAAPAARGLGHYCGPPIVMPRRARARESSITWPEGDREVLRSRRGFLVLCSLKMAMAMKPAERLDFGGADRHLGTRGFSGTLSTRVGPPAALSGPTVLPRTKGAPSLAATPWRPWCRRCWSRWRTSGAGSGRRRPGAGTPAAAAVGGLGHQRLLLC